MCIKDHLETWREAVQSLDDALTKSIAADSYDLHKIHNAMAALETAYTDLINDVTKAVEDRHWKK